MSATTAPHTTAAPRLAAKGLALLVLLSAAQFMVTVDVTITNLAAPSISRSLGISGADLGWVVTAYTVMAGSLLLLGGRLADLFGARRTFLAGLALFTTASLAAGLAQTEAVLLAARAAQGVGAAMLSPGALAVLVGSFTGAERTRALAVWGAVASAGAAVGVLLGGALTTWASWRWAFLVNVPVGALVAVLALRWVRADGPRAKRALDLPGAGLLVAALVTLVYGISRAPENGWGSARTLALFAASFAAFAAFRAVERRAAHPLVPPGLFATRTLAGGTAAMFMGTGLLIGVYFVGSLYMQQVLGMSALEAGLGFLPSAVTIAVATHVGSRLLTRAGSRVTVVLGLAVAAAGNLLLTGVDAGGSYAADVLPGLLVASAGVGLIFVTASVTTMHDVEHERAGLASGVLTTAHEIGAALGVAVFSAVAVAGTMGDAFAVAGIAGLLAAAVALGGFPSVRPEGARAMMH